MIVKRTIEKVEVTSKKDSNKYVIWSCNDEYVGTTSRFNSVKLNDFIICALCNLTPATFAEMPVGSKFEFTYEIKL